jgi:uncharacterized membrane protein
MGSIKSASKKNFLTGLVVLIPVIITIVVITWLFNLIDGIMAPIYDKILGRHIAGLGFISTIIVIYLVGMISSNVFGKRIISIVEGLLKKIPVFKGIYTSVKHVVDAFSPEGSKTSFKRFVIVEYPRKGSYAFGFLTKEFEKTDSQGIVEALSAVYIPTNNLYLGDIVLFKKEDVFHTDIAIDEGVKIIISGGIATPKVIKEEKA